MPSGWHTQDPASSEGLPLKKGAKALLEAYYRGGHLPSPMGGFLDPLRVRTESDGSGTVLFECSASSLRYELRVPKASRDEKAAVKAAQEADEPVVCPRCEPARRLRRAGTHLVCPRCGVRYGKPS
ncbi:hypothetical protein [Gaopeijia maritima]|uniref:Uncharacterized protein n=1 Tax=Gaopeijia maritima TaxID=3119007 RepID=A0ABU9EBV8_9BACT